MAQLLSLLTALCLHLCHALAGMDSCYEQESGRAQRCMPEFCNAAFGRTVLASHVCGSPLPEEFCLQTGVTGVTQSCHVCDAHDAQRSHNASSLNDFHSEEEPSWWQSPSMLQGIQFPNSVNLTLHLGKSFEITYIRLKFHTSRPESFAIYKRTREGAPWTPYQYYSASCSQTYGYSAGSFLRSGAEERVAFCTDEFSDISPLTGGNVAFSTLEGRPSAYSFDSSPMLQDWVTASDLLISLTRLNTFGDDIFKDHRVLRSYYYAISDLSVGGRCKCNGHASECVSNEQGRFVCDCQHNTAGVDCERCRPFFHARPWARGSSQAANECLPCNCSGRSEQCSFNMDLYRRTGHGGQCLNCRDNTAGSHCETCKEHFYRRGSEEACLPCNCSIMGSLSLQCDQSGDCICKATVTGKKCDQCQRGHHSLSEGGCRKCACRPEGTVGDCDPASGACVCKQNVEGALCHRCKSGTFNIQAVNPHGCSSCFCYGHSAACTSASQFAVHHIVSTFHQDDWRGQNLSGWESPGSWVKERISLFPDEGELEYFVAPAKFLGNQLLSYGQNLSFILRLESEEWPSFNLILGGSGLQVSASVFPHVLNDTAPWKQAVTFTLHEAEDGIQTPALSSSQFQQLLSNLTTVKLGARGIFPFSLMDVTLVTAQAGLSPRAAWVEECMCPEGYIGQFCESCAPGYKREVPSGGPLTPCVPCTCNQHGTCDPDSGICQCVHNTMGTACEHCASGYYGNPFRGRYNDCKSCPCPGQSNCAVVEDTKEVICTDCQSGQTGKRCEMCDDGFFGDPLGLHHVARPCSRCQCNGNTDLNAVGNCDQLTGKCLKCLFHTVGHYCDRCDDGFYGNALAANRPDKCRPCNCDPVGSINEVQTCNSVSGQCECLPHVTGRDCSQCEPGFYNLQPALGCLSCSCHTVGSRDSYCQTLTGQCNCRPGIGGRSCDKCQRGYFDLSERGCRACDCSPLGSVDMHCQENGSCLCKRGFVGRKCEQCQENYYYEASTFHCQLCPVCYGLVQDEVERLRQRMKELEEELDLFSSHPEQLYQLHSNHLQSAIRDMEAQSMQDDIRIIGSSEQEHSNNLEVTLKSPQIHNQKCDFFRISMGHIISKGGFQEWESANNEVKESLKKCELLVHLNPKLKLQLACDASPYGVGAAVSHIKPSEVEWHFLHSPLLAHQTRMAMEIESIVREALATSNRSHLILSGILEDNSIAGDITEAEDRLQTLQSKMEELTEEVEVVLREVKRLYTSTQKAQRASLTLLQNHTELEPEGWVNFTTELKDLESTLQTKEEQIEKLLLELEPQVKALNMGVETKELYNELLNRVKFAQATASASIQQAKRIKEEGRSLVKTLEDNKKLFSTRKMRNKGSFRKMGAIRERLLAEAKRKTAQASRMLRAAQSSSTISNATAARTLNLTRHVAKEAQRVRRRTRDQATQSDSLRPYLGAMQEQLQAQESQSTALKATVQEDIDTATKILRETEAMDKNMEEAKHSLDGGLKLLTELLKTIEHLEIDQVTDETLNKTKTQMGALRWAIDRTLARKVRELEAASEMQTLKMKIFEKDIEEIESEKHILEDIVQNLPQGCYNRVGL
ncbi:laminin subunit gamma-3-like [Scyliorhinus canicula]|uniref:laminin subunit gamma-3-like n=1 Tax=Scyliorhinus canicula TaxID=7830 RepID=UPI0018F28354|nr:laminin subunit gamma-3-like [Scyliorhinus canicula]